MAADTVMRWWNPFSWFSGSDRVTRLERRVERLDGEVERLRREVSVLAGLEAAPGAGPGPARPGPAMSVPDLVGGLRREAADLFSIRRAGPEDDAGPALVVEELDIEIRGDLDLDQGVGLRAYAADRASPQAASTIRFKLRPEVRIVAPPAEDES
jgi:hypothetical protein